MDKRKEANYRVKKNITETLLELMHEKSISEISITEIINRAGVARASFYRNYESKEDVLMTLVDDILEDFKDKADYDLSNCYTYEHTLRCFKYFKRFRKYVLDLYKFGYGLGLLEKLNCFHEKNAGNMQMDSIEKYRLYVFIGALFDTSIMWLKNGAKEEPEDIAKIFCREVGVR